MINSWLVEMQIGLMPSCGLLYDKDLQNLSAEEIYDRLTENMRQSARLETFRGYGKGDIIQDGYTGNLSAPTSLDDFCKNALRSGLEYHMSNLRGYIPAGLIEEIRALSMPPILVITDGYVEHDLCIRHEHAFLIPEGNRLPFRPRGKVFLIS